MTRAKSVLIGPLSKRSGANGHYVPVPPNFAPSERFCNSLQPNMSPAEISRLAMLAPPARAGSMQAFVLPSKGQGC